MITIAIVVLLFVCAIIIGSISDMVMKNTKKICYIKETVDAFAKQRSLLFDMVLEGGWSAPPYWARNVASGCYLPPQKRKELMQEIGKAFEENVRLATKLDRVVSMYGTRPLRLRRALSTLPAPRTFVELYGLIKKTFESFAVNYREGSKLLRELPVRIQSVVLEVSNYICYKKIARHLTREADERFLALNKRFPGLMPDRREFDWGIIALELRSIEQLLEEALAFRRESQRSHVAAALKV